MAITSAPNNGASKDFLTPIGFLEVTGPGVLPFAAQMFTCIRSRQCELDGAWPGAIFLSHGPVEIVDLPSYKMVIFPLRMMIYPFKMVIFRSYVSMLTSG